jgi:hypothetical protein
VSNEEGGWWLWVMCRKPKPDKSSNNDDFSQKIHTNLVEHLQCIADPYKLMKALNLGCLYSLSGQNPDAAGDPQEPKRFVVDHQVSSSQCAMHFFSVVSWSSYDFWCIE